MNDPLREHLIEGFEFAPVGLCITEFRKIVICNDEFSRMFGFQSQELVGQSLAILYPTAQEFDSTGELALPILRETGRYSDDRLMRHQSGRLIWCHVAGRSFRVNSPYEHAIWMFEDLSDRRKTVVQLTPREREIVKLLAKGLTSKQIAKLLEMSHRTVEAHRTRIGRKLDAKTTVEIVSKIAGLY